MSNTTEWGVVFVSPDEVRLFAKREGIPVNQRGRISKELAAIFNFVHRDERRMYLPPGKRG